MPGNAWTRGRSRTFNVVQHRRDHEELCTSRCGRDKYENVFLAETMPAGVRGS